MNKRQGYNRNIIVYHPPSSTAMRTCNWNTCAMTRRSHELVSHFTQNTESESRSAVNHLDLIAEFKTVWKVLDWCNIICDMLYQICTMHKQWFSTAALDYLLCGCHWRFENESVLHCLSKFYWTILHLKSKPITIQAIKLVKLFIIWLWSFL